MDNRDEEIMCELCNPPLSSVAPNPERIGYVAAELLDLLMAGQKLRRSRVAIDPVRVVARQSGDAVSVDDWVVANATRFIREQALHGCDVADVARKANVSRTTLEKRFRKCLRRSPKQGRTVSMRRRDATIEPKARSPSGPIKANGLHEPVAVCRDTRKLCIQLTNKYGSSDTMRFNL
jgi:AraC-like DNA-binding protein